MSESAAGDTAARDQGVEIYLASTRYIDSDNRAVAAYAREAVGDETDEIETARKLYYAVRDGVRYNPYAIDLTPRGFLASTCLERGYGFCVTKAALLAAVGRAAGIPTRVGFADVRNHLATKRLTELMGGSDVFVYHGYTELYLAGAWVKATPSFNLSLCEKFRVLPLEFDGRHDSIFHPFDADGRKHMEYVRHRGQYADVPFEAIRKAFIEHYPLQYGGEAERETRADFEAEAAAEN